MASIFKRGSTWWAHYYAGGKSVSRSLKTSDERAAIQRKKQLEALGQLDQLPQPSNTPVRTVVQAYCEYLIRTRPRKSAKNDITYLRSFFGTCCPALELGSRVPHKYRTGDRPLPMLKDKQLDRHVPVTKLEQVSAALINNFIHRRLVEDKAAPKTVNRFRGVMSALFSYAAQHHGYICHDRRYRNPVEGVKPAAEPAPEITWLTAGHIDEQLEALDEYRQIRVMVAVYLYAGLRREEALWLTDDDVDLEARLIRVRAKTAGPERWQPKTKSNRVVPISAALLVILKSYKKPVRSAWYFPSPEGHRWHPDNFSHALREINRAAGLRWSCADYRHTFGTHLAQKGESLFKIATLMGNSPEIARRHYAALVLEAMHDTVEFQPTAPAASQGPAAEAMQLLMKLLTQVDAKTLERLVASAPGNGAPR